MTDLRLATAAALLARVHRYLMLDANDSGEARALKDAIDAFSRGTGIDTTSRPTSKLERCIELAEAIALCAPGSVAFSFRSYNRAGNPGKTRELQITVLTPDERALVTVVTVGIPAAKEDEPELEAQDLLDRALDNLRDQASERRLRLEDLVELVDGVP